MMKCLLKLVTKNSPSNLSREAGFALPTVLTGILITSVATLIVGQQIYQTQFQLGSSKVMESLGNLKSRLKETIDCKGTFSESNESGLSNPTDACAEPKYIKVLSTSTDDNKILIDQKGTSQWVPWDIRAHCTSTGLEVRAARIKADYKKISTSWDFGNTDSDVFLKDLISSRVFNWEWDKSPKEKHIVFKAGEVCSSYFRPQSSSTSNCSNKYTSCKATDKIQIVTGNLAWNTGVGSSTPCYSSPSQKGIETVGTAVCPSGWVAVSGSSNCEFTLGSSSTFGGGVGGGFAVSGSQNSSWTSFSARCCTYVKKSLYPSSILNGQVPPEGVGAVMATCVPQS
jgi:hypothetical protein